MFAFLELRMECVLTVLQINTAHNVSLYKYWGGMYQDFYNNNNGFENYFINGDHIFLPMAMTIPSLKLNHTQSDCLAKATHLDLDMS